MSEFGFLRRFIVIGTITAAGSLTLSGCGGSSEQTSAEASTSTEATETPDGLNFVYKEDGSVEIYYGSQFEATEKCQGSALVVDSVNWGVGSGAGVGSIQVILDAPVCTDNGTLTPEDFSVPTTPASPTTTQAN